MGYAGKLQEKEIALKLRSEGFSYSEIQRKVKVSKDTISRWCRNVILTPEQMERLFKRKLTGGEKGRLIGSKVLQKRRLKETKELMEKGLREIGKLNKRERFVAGIALYAGEGIKTDGRIGFSNSDPELVKFMTKWFKEFCEIDNNRLRGAIWIHRNRNVNKALNYWSKLTGIPINNFYKTYIAENKTNSIKIRKNIHSYGIIRIGCTDSKIHRKIMGWTAGLTYSRMI